MNPAEYEVVVGDALRRQREAVWFQILFAGAIVSVGVIALLVVHLLPHTLVPDDQKWLMSIGATFISTLCGFPVHQIVSSRGRIDALATLARLLAQAAVNNTPLDPRLEDAIWKTLNKALGI
jgi:hypothetical protein